MKPCAILAGDPRGPLRPALDPHSQPVTSGSMARLPRRSHHRRRHARSARASQLSPRAQGRRVSTAAPRSRAPRPRLTPPLTFSSLQVSVLSASSASLARVYSCTQTSAPLTRVYSCTRALHKFRTLLLHFLTRREAHHLSRTTCLVVCRHESTTTSRTCCSDDLLDDFIRARPTGLRADGLRRRLQVRHPVAQ